MTDMIKSSVKDCSKENLGAKSVKSLMNRTMPLSSAVTEAPNVSGCYQLYMGDKLVYVGKAEDGIRKRFVQYYNGTTAHYSSAVKIYENRDKLFVKWKVIEEKDLVASKEATWIRNYKPAWNDQSGWGDKGVLSKKAGSNKAEKSVTSVGKNLLPEKLVRGISKSPELELGKEVRRSALVSVGDSVIATAVAETVKAVKKGDDVDTTVGNIVGEGTSAAISTGGGALVGEAAGLIAIGLGAGPVGWGIVTAGTALLAAKGISKGTEHITEGISNSVSEGVSKVRRNCDAVDSACMALERAGNSISDFWYRTVGYHFL